VVCHSLADSAHDHPLVVVTVVVMHHMVVEVERLWLAKGVVALVYLRNNESMNDF
jgi:hypothetical protein